MSAVMSEPGQLLELWGTMSTTGIEGPIKVDTSLTHALQNVIDAYLNSPIYF
jgi:hypothetical protein